MGFFHLSDLLIATTLILNSVCLLATKTVTSSGAKTVKSSGREVVPILIGEQQLEDEVTSGGDNTTADSGTKSGGENKQCSRPTTPLSTQLQIYLSTVRHLSGLLVIWNMFFLFLMMFIFDN